MPFHRVAILGGSGFVGRYIVKRLAERDIVVTVGCRNAAQAKYLKLKGDVGSVGLFNISIDDEALLPAFLAGNEALINCVGILRETGRQRFDAIQHTAPARLARLARDAGIQRFIHFSSLAADPRSPSAYARSKAEGEAAVRDAFPTATILRPSIVFGPEDQFFNRLAAMATISPVLPVIGSETRFQPIYVGDVAEAAMRCLGDPATAGRTYELGGPRTYSMRALVELLLAETRRKRMLIDLPFGLASLQARVMALLPNAPLTPDQVELLKSDNVVNGGALTLETLGIEPTPVEAILPTYLDRFRRGGWYERAPAT